MHVYVHVDVHVNVHVNVHVCATHIVLRIWKIRKYVTCSGFAAKQLWNI